MKVLHLYSSIGPGGAEKSMLSLAFNLQKLGVENVISCPKNSYLYSEARKYKLKTHPLTIRNLLNFIGVFNLLGIVKKENPDILHVHQGRLFWPSIIAKLLFKKMVIFHRHADIRVKWYSKWHYRFADKVIAVSEKVAENLIKYEKVLPKKIVVIYNGTSIEPGNPQKVRIKYNLGDRIVIGTIGAINKPEGKGQKYLIDVAKKLKNKYNNLHYLIVGDGTLKNFLQKYAADNGVNDIVTFTGYVSDIENYISAMDIVCLLSVETEGLGISLIEAQMLEKPVIGTNIGGIPETFLNGITGKLIPPRDIKALEEALIDLIENPEKRTIMGKLGRKHAIEKFNIRKWCVSVKSIYEDLMQIC